jgi:TonB family protein
MRRAILVAAFLPSFAFSGPPTWDTWASPVETLAEHRDGLAHWYEGAQRYAVSPCRATRPCEQLSIHIHNDSPRALQCHVILERTEPDDFGRIRIEGDRVILAGKSLDVTASRGAPAYAPLVTSACRMLDLEPPRPAMPSTFCASEITPPGNLQTFYPPGPIRREETGVVVLDLVVQAGETRAREVRVLVSSGFAELDDAALRAAKASTVRTDCLDAVVRRKIHFDKEPNEPFTAGSDYARSGDTIIWFEDQARTISQCVE